MKYSRELIINIFMNDCDNSYYIFNIIDTFNLGKIFYLTKVQIWVKK